MVVGVRAGCLCVSAGCVADGQVSLFPLIFIEINYTHEADLALADDIVSCSFCRTWSSVRWPLQCSNKSMLTIFMRVLCDSNGRGATRTTTQTYSTLAAHI